MFGAAHAALAASEAMSAEPAETTPAISAQALPQLAQAPPADKPAPAKTKPSSRTAKAGTRKGARFKDSEEGRVALAAAKTQPAEDTYRQLTPLEPRYAGDIDYDYLFGSAALDAGHPSIAVFVLQRAVATAPGFPGARLELARAYYEVGDNESARREFSTLQNENPPPQVAKAITEYLDAIDRRAAAYEPRYSALVEVGAGYDSNANGATDLQDFLGFTLNDRSQAQESPYYGIAAYGQLSYPLAPRWRLLGDAAVQQRMFPDASFVDTTEARLGGGAQWNLEKFTLSGVLSGAYCALDGSQNNTNLALDVTGVYSVDDNWQLGANARVAQLRFVDELSVQDVDTVLGGVAVTRSWTGRLRVQVIGALTAGQDRAVEDSSPYGRDLFGGRLTAFMAVRSFGLLSASVAALNSNYDGAFFGTDRQDDQYSVRVGFDWKDFPARFWGIGTQITYIDNQSSISLFEYNRVEFGLVLRREFR
jgi:tetratricopeptide (TPR) repeat protein